MLTYIGKEIRKNRKLRNITQSELAQSLAMSRTTVSQIESGSVQEIGARKLFRILDYLGLELVVQESGLHSFPEEFQDRQER